TYSVHSRASGNPVLLAGAGSPLPRGRTGFEANSALDARRRDLEELIDLDLDRAGKHCFPAHEIGLDAGIAGDLLPVLFERLRRVVCDLLQEAAGVVDVLQQP